jgi:LmbE family N-acetylglucosaminyl deacetylase
MDEVAAVRKVELDNAVEILGISRLVRLGYRDSGMMGWPHNSNAGSFWGTPVAEAAKRLADLLMEERPQVIVTYNEIGFYGHPDHIQANRITLAALEMIDFEPTLYYNAIPDSVFEEMRKRWEEEDESRREEGKTSTALEEVEEEISEQMSTPDELISAAVDIASVNSVKFDALAAHASQIADSFWMKMGREAFCETNKTEWFVRVTNPQRLEGCVTDIFAGYR